MSKEKHDVAPADDELIEYLSTDVCGWYVAASSTETSALIARIRQQDAEIERLRAACSQSRLAFAGLVSVQSAIDALDRMDLAALNGGEA